jgi:ABC-type transporter Mla subunit MlaD
MAESNSLNGIRAGIFVGSTLVLLGAVSFILSKTDFSGKSHYVIRFTTTEGVSGLNVGSDVRVGGMLAGKVEAVTPDFPKDGGPLKHIDVTISLASDVQLRWAPNERERSAMAMRVPSLLGNSASINFVRVGDETMPLVKPVDADPQSRIDAFEGGGMLAALVGPDNAEKARQMINKAADTMDYLNRTIPAAYDRDIGPTLANANAMVADLRRNYDANWRNQIGETLAGAASATGRVDTLLKDNDAAIRSSLSNAASTLENTRQMTDELRQKGMPKLLALLDDGAKAAQSLSDALGQVQQAMVTSLPSLEDFLENSRQMAAQLKLAAIEVRHSPWKILHQPDPGEVAHENLYDAARAFAMATDDLRAAGATLQQAVEKMPGALESDAAFRARVQREVLQAMGLYEQAQRRLFDVLDAPADKGGEGR